MGSMGLVYRSALVYRMAMRLLEGREGVERRRRIASAVPSGSEVVDLCCGDAALARPLRRRGCRYIGLDVNPAFVRSARRRGIDARYWEAESMEVPAADVICLLSSLYQFIPREKQLFDRMVEKAGTLVVLSEPIRNWSSSNSRLLRRLSLALTRVNGHTFEERHNERSLRALVDGLPAESVDFAVGGRDVVIFVWTKRLR